MIVKVKYNRKGDLTETADGVSGKRMIWPFLDEKIPTIHLEVSGQEAKSLAQGHTHSL